MFAPTEASRFAVGAVRRSITAVIAVVGPAAAITVSGVKTDELPLAFSFLGSKPCRGAGALDEAIEWATGKAAVWEAAAR